MMREFVVHMRRRWYLYLPLACVWALAAVRVFVDPAPHLPVLFNVTPSLPYTVAITSRRTERLVRGDYVIYAFHGVATMHFPGLRGQPFFKRVEGVAGDTVQVNGRRVLVNGKDVGLAKRFAAVTKLPLEPIAPQTIPPHYLYMHGTSPDSFDSRYRISGLVHVSDVIAVVRPLF
jgi:conjugal transfer pilin signal peptidase TrbI